MTSATARTPLFFGSDLQDTFRRGVIDPFRSLGVALRARSHRVPAQRPATPHRCRLVNDVAAQRLRRQMVSLRTDRHAFRASDG
ncbi:hypothetical protein CKJ65_17765 [Mycobacterium intracellulare]|nr:hypothetical protein CKJ65_17765 [Mycobacterium intracellulare]